MADACKITNPQHFGRDPADIQIWINPAHPNTGSLLVETLAHSLTLVMFENVR